MLWYTAPADPDHIIEEGLPIGNGRLGGLVTGGTASDLLLLTDSSLWSGGRNDVLDDEGRFSYDDVGFGTYSGRVRLDGRHGERTTTDGDRLGFTAGFDNGLRYAATVAVHAEDGEVATDDDMITFSGCSALTVIIAGGTSYRLTEPFLHDAPDVLGGPRPRMRPAMIIMSTTHVRSSAVSASTSRRPATSSGPSTPGAGCSAASRPASLTRSSRPTTCVSAATSRSARRVIGCCNLQSVWPDRNKPDWMSDYHTDINVQMNYWLTDRAGLTPLFDP